MVAPGSEPHVLSPEEETRAIAACQNGDRDAFEQLVRCYTGRAMGLARYMLRDHAQAEDMSQEAFVRAFRAIERFDLTQPFFPWFYRILKNCCLTALRKRKRRGVVFSIDTEDSPPVEGPPSNPGRKAEHSELRAQIDKALTRVNDNHREILMLAHFEELAYKEIAACLDIPVGTVMSRLWAARQALKRELGAIMGN
jgi:RNA polymerase sigma-70 factor (ECF subfamily)